MVNKKRTKRITLTEAERKGRDVLGRPTGEDIPIKAEVIAAMIGIPIPAKSIIVANDSMLPPLVIFVFLSIIRFEKLFLAMNLIYFANQMIKIICLIHQQIWHFLECIEIEVRAFFP